MYATRRSTPTGMAAVAVWTSEAMRLMSDDAASSAAFRRVPRLVTLAYISSKRGGNREDDDWNSGSADLLDGG